MATPEWADLRDDDNRANWFSKSTSTAILDAARSLIYKATATGLGDGEPLALHFLIAELEHRYPGVLLASNEVTAYYARTAGRPAPHPDSTTPLEYAATVVNTLTKLRVTQ